MMDYLWQFLQPSIYRAVIIIQVHKSLVPTVRVLDCHHVTPVAGPIFGPLSKRLIDGFHFEDGLISRFYFVPNPSNLVSQVLLCARSFHPLNRSISFRRSPDFQILLSSFWKIDRENVFYKCFNSGQMFLRYRMIFKVEFIKW